MTGTFGRLSDLFIVGYFVAATAMMWTTQPAVGRIRAELRTRRCADQLHEIGRALLAYQRDHGRFPRRFGMLYPRYIRDERAFVCPSAVRRIRQHREGYIVDLGHSRTLSAYLLGYLSPDFEATRGARGSLTPLVICDQHIQEVSDETWGQVYSGPAYKRRHGDPPYLILRLNGRVDRLPLSETRRRKWHTSNDF